MRPLARTAVRTLAPAALLAMALTGCGAGDDGTASSPAPTSTGSPEGTSSSTPSAAGAWDPSAAEAAIRELLGPGAETTVTTAEDFRRQATQNPKVDMLGPKGADDSAACTAARDDYSRRMTEAVAGGVHGTVEEEPDDPAAAGISGKDRRSMSVVSYAPGVDLAASFDAARAACGMAQAPSAGPEVETQEVTIGDAKGTAVQLVTRFYGGQTGASGAPDAQSATRSLSVQGDGVSVTSMETVSSAGDPAPLDAYVKEQAPAVERLLETLRG